MKSKIHQNFKRQFSKSPIVRLTFINNNFLQLKTHQTKSLELPITIEEIQSAVWACEGSKAPRLDDFTFTFIIAHWNTIKEEIINFVKEFEETGTLPRGCDTTFVTLIPKVKDPLTLSDYRPISLLGCQYKILSKILVERLKKVLPSVISDSQFAFIARRQILDGVLIANEAMRWFKERTRQLLLFKADFAKAFDSLNWGFLDSVLAQMHFGDKWRRWIRTCLSTVTVSVLVN